METVEVLALVSGPLTVKFPSASRCSYCNVSWYFSGPIIA